MFSIKITYYPIIQNYSKEYPFPELTQLYSFTGLKIVQNYSETEENQNTDEHMNSKSNQQKELVHQTSPKPNTKTSQKKEKIGK